MAAGVCGHLLPNDLLAHLTSAPQPIPQYPLPACQAELAATAPALLTEAMEELLLGTLNGFAEVGPSPVCTSLPTSLPAVMLEQHAALAPGCVLPGPDSH